MFTMENYTSFDKLVMGISNDERVNLLKKLESNSDPEKQNIEVKQKNDNAGLDITIRYQKESFFVRLWLRLKSLFTSNGIEYLYNEYLVSNVAKEVDKDYPNLIDYKNGYLLEDFYIKLTELKKVADFFRPGISVYEENQGAFFVFLGSLITPELSETLETEVSPYKYGLDREVTSELRASLIRKMDEILQSIPNDKRMKLYDSIRSIEWLKYFTKLPFERLISKFVTFVAGSNTCPIDSVSSELSSFARVLCNGKKIHTEVLEALYLFSEQSQKIIVGANADTDIVNQEGEEYLKKSIEQISLIKMFITSIPIASLATIATNSSVYEVEKLGGIEDWFIKYKNHWKKIFDQRWENWLRDKKKYAMNEKIKELFETTTFPFIPNRPWQEIWGGIPFSKEYTLGFIYAFFKKIYPNYNKVLKVIMVEGDFIQRENRIEFTDTYNMLNHIAQTIVNINEQLSPRGAYGISFNTVIKESLRTIQGQTKINNLLATIEKEVASLATQFSESCRKMQLIFTGILSNEKNTRYDTLVNISTIQGKTNIQFRQQMKEVHAGFGDILDLVKDIETIDVSYANKS